MAFAESRGSGRPAERVRSWRWPPRSSPCWWPCPPSYAIARYRSAVRNATIGWILISQVFPFILSSSRSSSCCKQIGLINTLPGLVIVYVVWALPFTLWMLQGYVAAIPRDLEEAASTDGANRFVILRSIIFPLLLPGLVATSMFAFINAWNEFFFALVIIQDPALQTAPLLLARYVGAEGRPTSGRSRPPPSSPPCPASSSSRSSSASSCPACCPARSRADPPERNTVKRRTHDTVHRHGHLGRAAHLRLHQRQRWRLRR